MKSWSFSIERKMLILPFFKKTIAASFASGRPIDINRMRIRSLFTHLRQSVPIRERRWTSQSVVSALRCAGLSPFATAALVAFVRHWHRLPPADGSLVYKPTSIRPARCYEFIEIGVGRFCPTGTGRSDQIRSRSRPDGQGLIICSI